MTLDKLRLVFNTARVNGKDGIRAVVEALRDEILRDYGGNNYSWCERVALGSINEILASDGVEMCEAVDAKECATPSPAAAPVCEWTPKGIFHGARVHVAACDGGVRATYGFTHCPTCKRPISFKSEAAR